MSNLFIDVGIDVSIAADLELAARLEEVCPVDIFRAGPRGLEIVTENLDECVLCGLCLDASPPGSIRVLKLYDGGAVLEAHR
ncbi:MAG TPA: ferredoxin family protein [Solirubrobacteraceae bacterium]